MTYKDWIEDLKKRNVGKKVILKSDGHVYTIVDVDYNGALMIDKKAQFTDTTAVSNKDVLLISPGAC